MGISCCEMLILCWNNLGELLIYFCFTNYRPFQLFLFVCLFVLTLDIIFLGASWVCVYKNLKRTADLAFLWFSDKTSVCTHPWHQNELIVFMVPLNLTKLNIYCWMPTIRAKESVFNPYCNHLYIAELINGQFSQF